MIKRFMVGCLAICGLFFVGCAKLDSTPEAKNSRCESPFAFVSMPQISFTDNDLKITEEEVQEFLKKEIDQDKCLAVSQVPDASNFKIIVQSHLDTNKKEGVVSTAQESIATIKTSFILSKDRTSSQFNSEQSLKINGKKVLGIGKGAQISQKDRQMLLQRAVKKSYEQMLGALR